MAVLTALAEAGAAVSTVALEARVDLRRTPLELLLKVLAVDGAWSASRRLAFHRTAVELRR